MPVALPKTVPMAEDDESDSLRPEISQIIESGQEAATASGSVRPVIACSAVSMLVLWLSFTPVDAAPAAWLAFVPLCLLLRVSLLPKFSYRAVAVVGFVWGLATLQWMRLGHPSMYGALVALAFYMSLYFPAFLALSRGMIRVNCPMWLAVPVVWTALEFVRAHLMTGFSWYYLGHTQYRWTSLVQIADITGTWGISFLIALAAAALAECLPASVMLRLGLAKSEDEVHTLSLRRKWIAVGTAVLLIGLSCVYGFFRATPVDQPADGPVVAVVQGNYAPEVKADSGSWGRIWMDHEMLSRTAAGLRPDLIVWPETMYPERDVIIEDGVDDSDLVTKLTMPGNVSNSDAAQRIIAYWRSRKARERIEKLADETGTALMIGLLTEVHQKNDQQIYNSAAFLRPLTGYAGRYDKRHRVPFGEYVPLQEVLPVLARLTPYSAGFGISAGQGYSVFEQNGVRYAPVICFEDTVPHLVRDAALTKDKSGETADVLINLTNDAWFRGSSALDQHLITSTFRCIETRRPLVRAVNGGISAYIDSTGRIRQPEHFLLMKEDESGVITDFERVDSMFDDETGLRYRQCSSVLCGQIPLDGRDTIYRMFGDWFPILCLGLVISGLIAVRIKDRSPEGDGEQIPVSPAQAA